jgi:hypothetical protein
MTGGQISTGDFSDTIRPAAKGYLRTIKKFHELPVFQSTIAKFTWFVVYAQGKAREGCSSRNSADHQSGVPVVSVNTANRVGYDTEKRLIRLRSTNEPTSEPRVPEIHVGSNQNPPKSSNPLIR